MQKYPTLSELEAFRTEEGALWPWRSTRWYINVRAVPPSYYAQTFWDLHPREWEKTLRERWYWERFYGDVLDHLTALGARGPLLDIGTGCGLLPYVATQRGWLAHGMDPDAKTYARYIATFPNDFTISSAGVVRHARLNYTLPAYGTVTAFLVLEHLHRPDEFVRAVARMAHRPKHVVFMVPNEFNPLQQRLTARHGPWWISRYHRNYWTALGFREFLEAYGYDVLDEWRTFPMEWFALHGLDYIAHPRLGGLAHHLRMLIETLIGRRGRQRLRRLWLERDWGREVILFARV